MYKFKASEMSWAQIKGAYRSVRKLCSSCTAQRKKERQRLTSIKISLIFIMQYYHRVASSEKDLKNSKAVMIS